MHGARQDRATPAREGTVDRKRALSGRGACLPFGNIAKIRPLLDLGLLGMLIWCGLCSRHSSDRATWYVHRTGRGAKVAFIVLVSESLRTRIRSRREVGTGQCLCRPCAPKPVPVLSLGMIYRMYLTTPLSIPRGLRARKPYHYSTVPAPRPAVAVPQSPSCIASQAPWGLGPGS